jgi:hypothetical protein
VHAARPVHRLQCVGGDPGGAAGGVRAAPRSRVATITGALSAVVTVAVIAFSPRTPE